MDLDTFQKKAMKTAIYPNKGNNLIYPTLGLVGEAGEVAEKVKKMLRDDGGEISKQKKEELIKELGDVLWYVSGVAYELKTTLSEVVKVNMEKLSSRKIRNKLQGSGDNR